MNKYRLFINQVTKEEEEEIFRLVFNTEELKLKDLEKIIELVEELKN